MKEELKMRLARGSVVQINRNVPHLSGQYVTVTAAKPWGAEGYLQELVEPGQPRKLHPLTLQWKDMEYVGETAIIYPVAQG